MQVSASHTGKQRLVAGLLVLVFIVPATIAVLWTLKFSKYNRNDFRYGVRIVDKNTAEQAAENRKDFFANAMLLRTQWQPWASNHKQLLIRLLNAKPDDLKTFNLVSQSIPENPFTAGLKFSSDPSQLTTNSFSWSPGLFHVDATSIHDRDARAKFVVAKAGFLNHVTRRFRQFHDIELARSLTPGVATITLWASGRITEEAYVHQTIPNKPVVIEGVPKELVPSYNFLSKRS